MSTATNSPVENTAHEEELPSTAVSTRANAKSIRELRQITQEEAEPIPVIVENVDPEETTWKQRYADLRRHSQSKETALSKEMKELKEQVNQLSNAANRPTPKSQEEFDEWKKNYPDIVPFIEQLAEEKANARSSKLEEELESVKLTLEEAERAKALSLLRNLVPDIAEIPSMPEYAEWLDSLSTNVRNRVENSDDPYEVRDYMKMFKAWLGKPIKTTVKSSKIDALDTSVKNTGSSMPRNSTQFKYKESEISKMSPEEYATHEADIESAMREGKVLMDSRTNRTSNV